MSLTVKIEFNGSKRLLKGTPQTFEQLNEQIQGRFSTDLPKKYQIRYKDPEDEWIRISTSQDLISAYTYILSLLSIKSITFVITEDNCLSDSYSEREEEEQELDTTLPAPSNKSKRKPSTETADNLLNESNVLGEIILKEFTEVLKEEQKSSEPVEEKIFIEEQAQKISESSSNQVMHSVEIKEEKDKEVLPEPKPESVEDHLKHFFECLLKAKPQAADLQGLSKAPNQEQVDLINEVINCKLRIAFEDSFYEKKFCHTVERTKEEVKSKPSVEVQQEKKEAVENNKISCVKKVSIVEPKIGKYKCKVVSCPDNMQVEPETPISAFFVVQNTGESKWPINLYLCGTNGWDDQQISIPVGETAVLEKQDIEVKMISSKKEGVFLPSLKLSFKNENGDFTQFGPKLSFEVKI